MAARTIAQETTITVPYEELSRTALETIDGDGASAVVSYKCAWADRFTLAREMLGFVDVDDQGNTLYTLPHRYPHRPDDILNWFAVRYQMRPFFNAQITRDAERSNDVEDIASFPDAELQVFYTTTPTPLFRETIEGWEEFLTLPHAGVQWLSDGGNGENIDPSEAPQKHIIGWTWVITFFNLRTVPKEILSLTGTTNELPMTALSVPSVDDPAYFEAGQLLMQPFAMERMTLPDGSAGWILTLRINVHPKTWNHQWRQNQESGGWDQLSFGGAAIENHPPADWSILPFFVPLGGDE